MLKPASGAIVVFSKLVASFGLLWVVVPLPGGEVIVSQSSDRCR